MQKALSYLFFIVAIIFASCRHDDFIEDADVELRFSVDTLVFDTVFASVGSITLVLQVYNDYSSDVRISSLRLAKGNASLYRLNVDGMPGRVFTDVEIPANDSLFIFCEVTVDPNITATPFIVSDSIVFTTNGTQQDVDLVAYGQNAHFHTPPPGSLAFFVDACGGPDYTWASDLPHVVYGWAIVDSCATLTIQANAKVYFHPGSGIIVLSGGTLLVNGTKDSVVTFQGDRLEADYREIPGQWGNGFNGAGIWLSNISHANITGQNNSIAPGTQNSVINYAVIKNGNIGLLVDTVYDAANITLTLTNTIIENMSGSSLVGQGTRIISGNCVFANAAQFAAALVYGGSYDFRHCTFANFWNYSDRTQPTLLINNYFPGNPRPIDSAYFGNCIVYGNKSDGKEIALDSSLGGAFNFFFKNSLIQVGGAFATGNPAHFNACRVNANPKFKYPEVNNYELDTLSHAIDTGSVNVINTSPLILLLQNDIKGVDRMGTHGLPDCGAYERPD